MTEWQTIETAPKDGTVVMVWEDGVARHWEGEFPYTPRFARWDDEDGYWLDPDETRIKHPTWWAPMPVPGVRLREPVR